MCEVGRMNTPKTPEELTAQIERAVRGYLVEVQRAAQEAVARAFSEAGASPGATSARRRGAPAKSGKSAPRRYRSAAEIARVQEALEAAVRQFPGTSLSTLAEELQVPMRKLQIPMGHLKRAGRVRAVGERHLTRYFPAVGLVSSED